VRCFGSGDPLYELYHDAEWGRPVLDERGIFERISLEAFQSGLSWITILRKRDAFRRAFLDFEPDRVARMGDRDVKMLMADPGIVRNRGKIEATIANGRAIVELHRAGRTLGEIVWSYERPAIAPRSELPAFTDESKALSKELRKLGLRFVGPTTAYAAMQAIGVVNDHLPECHVREAVERERSERPRSAASDFDR
jgi:DNA-3-methyladenine glycosylase I